MPDGHAVCSRLGDLYGEGVVVSTLPDGIHGLGRVTSHCAWAARSELGMYEGEFRRSKLTWHLRNEVSHGGLRPEFIRCRSEEHTSALQSLMRISYAVFCLKKKT